MAEQQPDKGAELTARLTSLKEGWARAAFTPKTVFTPFGFNKPDETKIPAPITPRFQFTPGKSAIPIVTVTSAEEEDVDDPSSPSDSELQDDEVEEEQQQPKEQENPFELKTISLAKPLPHHEQHLVPPQYQKVADFAAIREGRIEQDDETGFRVYNMVNEDIIIAAHTCKMVSTGLYISKWHYKGYFAQLMTRSTFARHNISIIGGVIDPEFKGQIKVVLSNHNDRGVIIHAGAPIARMVLMCFQPGVVTTQTHVSDIFDESSQITIIDDIETQIKRLHIKGGKENRPPKSRKPIIEDADDIDDFALLDRALS